MRFLLAIILCSTGILPVPSTQESTTTRFTHVDIYVDSKDKPLAAYQLEFNAYVNDVKLVGIEGGAHAAFKDPPYYDPAALSHNQVILAAFNTGQDLPKGIVRVARLHLQIEGNIQPNYIAKLTVAADAEGKTIQATASVQEGEVK